MPLFAQNVGIGTTKPAESAALDITNSSKGILIPRMTEAQRTAIPNPSEGLLVFQTDNSKGFWYFDGSSWTTLISCAIGSLDCFQSTQSGLLIAEQFSSANITIPYTEGTGCAYSGQSINSTSITGLSASLSSGKFAVGSGNLSFNVSGVTALAGLANFSLSIGAKSCVFKAMVYPAGSATGITAHTCGSANVHNAAIPYGTMTDQQGNTYRTVQIGNQLWMAENLKTTQYRNGDAIPNITDNTVWANTLDGACCSYENNISNDCPYGKLYNWYAVNDSRNICPTGWRVPSSSDLSNLVAFLGGPSRAGGKMKSTGTQFWYSPNIGATNESGFSGLPGAYRLNNGSFGAPLRDGGFWWTTFSFGDIALFSALVSYETVIYNSGYNPKKFGYSVRCIKE